MGHQTAGVKTHVARRKVFYIPGYDPFPPRRYRELYRREGRAQGAISGYALDVKAEVGAPFAWSARLENADGESRADIEVLFWADIVQGSMARSILATYGQLASTAWTYIISGALFRLMSLRQGPVIAALYPVVFLLAQLALALVCGYGLFWGIGKILPQPFGFLIGASLGALLVWAVIDLFRRWDNRFFAYYLMHDYAYSARLKGGNPPELESRMAEFSVHILEALEGDFDEVLIVGHSSGAHLGVSVLADVLRARPMPDTPLGFLTLGQVVPMVSFLPKADRLRTDLAHLGAAHGVTWVDVTAPGDGCAFALCDPVAVSGAADERTVHPLVISAAFSKTLSPERWRALKWRFFRLHFQYLCAFDRPGDYDYFQITAGPIPLAARFAGRKPSPSRRTRAVNGYGAKKS